MKFTTRNLYAIINQYTHISLLSYMHKKYEHNVRSVESKILFEIKVTSQTSIGTVSQLKCYVIWKEFEDEKKNGLEVKTHAHSRARHLLVFTGTGTGTGTMAVWASNDCHSETWYICSSCISRTRWFIGDGPPQMLPCSLVSAVALTQTANTQNEKWRTIFVFCHLFGRRVCWNTHGWKWVGEMIGSRINSRLLFSQEIF